MNHRLSNTHGEAQPEGVDGNASSAGTSSTDQRPASQLHASSLQFNDQVQEVISRLVGRYRRRLHLDSHDAKDFEQSLALHVVEQSVHFDPERGSYHGFVSAIIRNRAKSLMRSRFAQCRDRRRKQSLNKRAGKSEGRPLELADRLLNSAHDNRLGRRVIGEFEHSDLAMDLYRVGDTLTSQQRQICAALPRGTVTSVARDLGLSKDQVRREMQTILERFQDAGLEKYIKARRLTLFGAAA